jgi:hypothetical protein
MPVNESAGATEQAESENFPELENVIFALAKERAPLSDGAGGDGPDRITAGSPDSAQSKKEKAPACGWGWRTGAASVASGIFTRTGAATMKTTNGISSGDNANGSGAGIQESSRKTRDGVDIDGAGRNIDDGAGGGNSANHSGESVAKMKVSLAPPETDSYSKETLEKIRKTLGTDQVVLGSFVPLGEGEIRVDMRMQDAAAGETIVAVSERGTVEHLDDLVYKAGAKLRSKMGAAAVSVVAEREGLPEWPEEALTQRDWQRSAFTRTWALRNS